MPTNRHMFALAFCLLASLTAGAQTQPLAKRTGTIVPLPLDLEIELALSSLPTHLRDQATVYVLNPAKGFEVARTGTNGFSTLVARTGDDAMRGSWPLTAYPDDAGRFGAPLLLTDARRSRPPPPLRAPHPPR